MGQVSRVCALAGGVLSLATALLVTASVLSRWLLQQPIPGDFEFVQMATAICVFAFLPLCQWHRGNIVVDSFTTRLSERTRNLIDAVWDIVYAGIMALFAWGLLIGAHESFANGTTTMMLGLPLWPAIAVSGVLCALLAAVSAVTATELIRGRE
jgi:TRAP-type C4-dicarboxylate transport system permease small subunit